MDNEISKKTEPLCAELQKHLVDYGDMIALKHPLVFDVPYFKQFNARLNQMLKIKKQEVALAKKNCKFGQFIFLHERPYRINAFLKIANFITTDEQWWGLVRGIWIDSENIHEWGEKNILFIFERANNHLMMDENELNIFKELPKILTIYRGLQHNYEMV